MLSAVQPNSAGDDIAVLTKLFMLRTAVSSAALWNYR